MAEDLAALDQLVDADDLLLDDAAGAHVEVTDLRRSLIAGPEADGPAGGAEDRVGVGREDVGQDLGVGERDGVTRVVASDAPAVAYDQDDGSPHGTPGLAGTTRTVHVRNGFGPS